ncbi:hypothetical protein JKP88DRAFT_163595 [Tribonema minus]|uniref:Ankyrin repeat-containing domain n=1 Tax=Tribonema minus TaxID=303371 RepID=A0A836CFK4_9STRA|nr:hypothetical protein JKP88DRAFT_163595 [Tribonema minus]
MTHAAAKSLKLVKLLREEDDCEWDVRAGNAAAHAGLIDVLDYLSDSGCEIEANVHSIAAESGHVHVMRWAHQKGIVMDEEWFWRHLHGAQLTLSVAQYLADKGHIDSMLLHDVSVAPGVTRQEAHEAVQWMKGAGIPVTPRVCAAAARDGNLSVLAALRSMNVTWNEQVCTSAADHAHLHILKWAMKNGCPYSAPDLTFAALTSCNMAVIQYLSDKQLLTPPSILGYHEMMHVTEACDTQRLSRWLLKHGYQ